MTTIERELIDRTDEAPDRGLIRRAFAAEVSAGDGRTLDVRIVPYGERIVHDDGHGGVPKGVPYTEEWVPGAFEGQTRAPNRVLVNVEHEEGIRGIVGHGVALLERSDALYGSFKIHETPEGDKALMLVREGVFGGVSLEAVGKKSIRAANGVVQRVKAHLRGIALCREPAYANAVVLAIREAPIFDEELLPVLPDPELIERCRRLGIALPQRYQAHPDDTGTPDEAGTPASGTRLDEESDQQKG